MIGSVLISNFETYVDDTTELSSDEELVLLNKIYNKIWDDRDWEFAKKEATGSLATSTTITLPTDFSHLVEDYNYTDNSYSMEIGAKPIFVFVGDVRYQVVNWSDRRRYVGNSNVCYVDIVNGTIVFPVAPASSTYSFDYKYTPVDLTLATEPVFPARYHYAIYHGMASDDMIIQLFDKARSYSNENQAKYYGYVADMGLWNANLMLN